MKRLLPILLYFGMFWFSDKKISTLLDYEDSHRKFASIDVNSVEYFGALIFSRRTNTLVTEKWQTVSKNICRSNLKANAQIDQKRLI